MKIKNKDIENIKLTEEEKNDIVESTLEEKIIHKENIKFWLSLGIAATIILIIFVISAVLNIYKTLNNINHYLGLGVTILIIILLLIFIVIPFIKMLNAPTFTIDATKDIKHISNYNYHNLKQVAKNLVEAKNSIPDAFKEKLSKERDRYALRDLLNEAYTKYIKKDIDKVILAMSWKVGATTAVSQNSSFDAFTTIVLNIRMIMQITVKCGYRPSYIKLSKLIIKVFKNAVIAYSLQSLNVGKTLVSMMVKQLEAFSGIIGASTEGAMNALLTVRIGTITRKYLFNEFKNLSKIMNQEEARNKIAEEAMEEALNLLKEEEAYA
jgi:uncharacterized membrane protein YcjF (UPF0283 family)